MKNEDFLKEFDRGKNPLKVPPGYFSAKKLELIDIPDQVEDETQVRRLRWGNAVAWSLGIAAALTLGLFFFPQTPANTISIEEITSTEVSDYLIDEYAFDLNSEEVFLSEIEMDELEDISFDELNQDDIDLEDLVEDNFDQILHYEYL